MFEAVLFLFIRFFSVAVQGYENTVLPTTTAQIRGKSELISIIYLLNYRIPWLQTCDHIHVYDLELFMNL